MGGAHRYAVFAFQANLYRKLEIRRFVYSLFNLRSEAPATVRPGTEDLAKEGFRPYSAMRLELHSFFK